MPASEPSDYHARLDAALDDPADASRAVGAGIGPDARDRLVRYVELLAKWNRVWNLTAVRDPIEMIDRHLVDCLTLLPFLGTRADGDSESSAFDLIDVGSGAGLPGIVLAAARPELRVLSVERTAKKARFQRQAVLQLGLPGVEVRGARVEDVHERARIVTSRAFASPRDFLAVAAPLSVPGGVALVMLGRAERLPEPPPSPWTLERLERTGTDPERHVAVCRHGRIPYDPAP